MKERFAQNLEESSAEKNKIFFVLYLTHPHVCRHTYCTNMARVGVNPKSLQYLMGHADMERLDEKVPEVRP